MTYGTFAPGPDGALFPGREQVKLDFAAIREHGFTVVRTYTEPTEWVLEAAADWDLCVLAGIFYEDWRYMVGTSAFQRRALERAARRTVEQATRRLAGCDQVLGICVGNEVPADVVRWLGTRTVSRGLGELVRVVHDTDADQLATYANYPTAEYLSVGDVDFSCHNVFLEDPDAYRRYLTRLQHLADDRPVVLSEVGAPGGFGPIGERRQADMIEWQLTTALERGVAGTCLFSWTDDWWVAGESQAAWGFGLTREDRSPKPALAVARRSNARSVADLDCSWPSISVVVCAFNAAATLDECLRHTCALDYPGLEILVVDDGSTDDTAAIAARHPRVRLVCQEHMGLSTARNAGLSAAQGELVAYLDADAYPSPEWPYYLALGLDGPRVGGVGGPNLPPATDPPTAQRLAAGPGGPVHVLFSDDRAEHVPGCNMAFWRDVLVDAGGFDPLYTAAGDDVDLCWRVLEGGWEIGFHPAAVVWHHPRVTTRGYLRQQWGYGRSEALVEARHPDRFTSTGSARWRGSIYGPGRASAARPVRQRIYRGPFGSAAFQSVYRGGHGFEFVHQIGVPVGLLLVTSAVFGAMSPYLAIPALCGAALLGMLFALDAARCRPPAAVRGRHRRFAHRCHVATLHVLQPIARTLGRHHRTAAASVSVAMSPGPTRKPRQTSRIGRRVVVVAEHEPRPVVVSELVADMRRRQVRVMPTTGWEDHDARIVGSLLVNGQLVTSSHPPGWIQMRVRLATRPLPLALSTVSTGALLIYAPGAAVALVAFCIADAVRGCRRVGRAREVVRSGGQS